MILEALLSLLASFAADTQVCYATTFAQKGDKHLGGDSPYLKRAIRPTDKGIAHREFPLGSLVELLNIRTNRSTVARVIDRGPFGAVGKNGKWKNDVERFRRARRNGEPIPRDGWRACVDMTPATAKAIGANGMEPVFVRRVKRNAENKPHKARRRKAPSV